MSTTINISSGQTSANINVTSGSTYIIQDGGSLQSSVIESGATVSALDSYSNDTDFTAAIDGVSVSGGELNLLDDSVSKDVTLDDGVVSGTSQARIFGLTVNSGSAAFTGSWLNDVQVSGGTLNIYESVTVDQLGSGLIL